MYETVLNPNFNKLKEYFPNITDTDIIGIEKLEGVPLYLEYMSKEGFLKISKVLQEASIYYGIEDHNNELLYLILQKNEQIRERYDAYWQNYEDDQTSAEIAKFLLAFKDSKPNQAFQLVAKPITGSVAIKDAAVAKWMGEQIYKAIEARQFPLDIFGEKILYNLFGDEFDGDAPISRDTLKEASLLKPRVPTVRIKKLLVEFCLYLQVYLIKETKLTAPEDVLLTDAQANLFFDILECIGYLDRDKIQSDPKDYMHAMFKNHIK